MGRGGRLGRLGVVAAALLVSVAAGAAPVDGAAPGDGGGGRAWVVDRLRVESLDADGFSSVGGVGDYRGALEVVRSGAGLALVNEVGFEDYVRGIAEVPSSWPMEVLRAQAIAARTYALHEMGRPRPRPGMAPDAHICATQACQVYVGLAKERGDAGQRWAAAVESTRGQVLVDRRGPIRAMYSSGQPLPPAPGPRPPAPAPAAPAPPPPPAPGGPSPAPPPPPLLRLPLGAPQPPPAPPGGPPPAPAPVARPAGAPPPADPVAAPRFRGHGVGMSQYGALEKGQRGAKAPAILASYYKGARLTRLPDERLPPTIRVGLEPVLSSMVVSGSGRFRLLDGAGRTVAVAATGQWRATPAPGGGVRVVPPPGQGNAPAVEALGYQPLDPPPGTVVTMRVTLSAPAMVHLTVEAPDSPPAPISAPQLMEAGEWPLTLGPLAQAGPHVVSVVADAGGDRVATVPVTVTVRPPGSPGPASLAGPSSWPRAAARSPTALVAWALVMWGVVAMLWLRPPAKGVRSS